MFQNISNDFTNNKNHCGDVKLNNEEIYALLKKVFSKQNIIICIISFMISMVSFRWRYFTWNSTIWTSNTCCSSKFRCTNKYNIYMYSGW